MHSRAGGVHAAGRPVHGIRHRYSQSVSLSKGASTMQSHAVKSSNVK